MEPPLKEPPLKSPFVHGAINRQANTAISRQASTAINWRGLTEVSSTNLNMRGTLNVAVAGGAKAMRGEAVRIVLKLKQQASEMLKDIEVSFAGINH